MFHLHPPAINIQDTEDDLAFKAVIVDLKSFLSLLIVPLIPFVEALSSDNASTLILHEPLASHQVLIMRQHPEEALCKRILH